MRWQSLRSGLCNYQLKCTEMSKKVDFSPIHDLDSYITQKGGGTFGKKKKNTV